MDEDVLLVVAKEATAEAVETAFDRDAGVTVRAVDDLNRLFGTLCYGVVSVLLLPTEFQGARGVDVARGVRGLYPDLPVLIASGAGGSGGHDDGDEPDCHDDGDEHGEEQDDEHVGDQSDREPLDVRTVEAAELADERVVAAVAELLAEPHESAASRPPTRLETLAMSMVDGFEDYVYAKDAEARHVLASGETVGLETVVGRTDEALPDAVDELERKSRRDDEYVISTGNPVIDREEYTGGENEYTLTSKVPWYDADGSVVGLAGVSRDITTRKSRERALRRQNERLAKIAIVAAHELRNELQVATGRLPHVGDDPSQLEVVSESLGQLETIVDDVVKLATAERRGTDEETEWLSTPAREVWQSVATADATLDVVADRLVNADPEAIRLFFEILLSNAVEHGGSAVTVTIGTTSDGFYVADDGAGIAFDPPERVFDAGFASTDADAGFGLYVAQRIAADHGWTLAVGDGPDGGARFDVNGVDGP